MTSPIFSIRTISHILSKICFGYFAYVHTKAPFWLPTITKYVRKRCINYIPSHAILQNLIKFNFIFGNIARSERILLLSYGLCPMRCVCMNGTTHTHTYMVQNAIQSTSFSNSLSLALSHTHAPSMFQCMKYMLIAQCSHVHSKDCINSNYSKSV